MSAKVPVRLRKWDAAHDAQRFLELANNRNVSKGLASVPYPITLEFASHWLLTRSQGKFSFCICIPNDAASLDASAPTSDHQESESFSFTKPCDSSFLIVGGIGGHPSQEPARSHAVGMGYWLGEQYWGKGIATEAVRILIEAVKSSSDLDSKVTRMEAKVFDWNVGSAKVLEKNGFSCEGRLRRDYCKEGVYMDTFMYAKLLV